MSQQSFPDLVKPPIALGVSNGRKRKSPPSPNRVIHLIRLPLPLGSNDYTECGRELSEDQRLLRWEDWIVGGVEQPGVREKLCRTCASVLNPNTMQPWYSWENDPLQVLNRNTAYRQEVRKAVAIDLWALVQLAEKHRDEFAVLRHVIDRRKRLRR